MSIPDQFETWDMEVMFSGKTHVSGGTWVLIEQERAPNLPMMPDDAFIGLDMSPDTDVETARRIIDFLNRHVTHITVTAKRRPEWEHVPGRGEKWRRENPTIVKLWREREKRRGRPDDPSAA